MTFETLTGLFVLVVAIHNLEEALWLPAWSQRAGRRHITVGAREFRFAVAVLTAAAAAAAWLAYSGGRGSIGAYLLSGYALAMLLNVIFPHVLATLVLREYTPGTLTALLLNLPVCALLLEHALREQYVETQVFLWAGPLTVLAIVAAIPLLFAIGRRLPVEKTGPGSGRSAISESSDAA
jgi:Protein of unknown function with HXXEE motif